MTAQRRQPGVLAAVSGTGSLYAFLYCILLSRVLTEMPLTGGTLYMCGRVTALYMNRFVGDRMRRRWRIAGTVLLALLLAVNLLALMFLAPQTEQHDLWLLFAIILTMTMRDILGRRLLRSGKRGVIRERLALLRYGAVQLVLHVTGVALLLGSTSGRYAWMLAVGYLLAAVGEISGQLYNRQNLYNESMQREEIAREWQDMRQSYACVMYEAVYAMVLAALQVTLIMMYAYLAITAEELLRCMVIGVLCMLAARWMAERIMKRRGRTEGEPINMMVIGLFLWLYGIFVFRGQMEGGMPDLDSAYFCMGLCTAGATVCITCLSRLLPTMQSVARFATGREIAALDRIHRVTSDFAVLAGQMLGLTGLTLFTLLQGNPFEADLSSIALTFRPLMVAPSLLMVLGALIAALRFPLSKKYMTKLHRFMQLEESGGRNPALRRQLEKVLMHRHTQPLFTRVLIALLRPFYKHTLQGTEHVVDDVNNPTVFLCNHGEFYGPVVGVLYIPVPVRPWTISDIMIDKDETAEYVHRFTISRQKWLPERLKMPIARLIGRLSVWVMNQLETIPVYRNKLTQLKTTFRLSVEAMEAGDNLLIFPENPDADPENPGYQRDGAGELFAGFVMLAQVYHAKTGKCCRFQPMFAHKGMRTLTFCEPVMYDPDNDPIAERDRIVAVTKEAMDRVYAQEEAKYQQKHGEAEVKG